MLHNQVFVGFSLLVLTCASPTLAHAAEPSTASLDPASPPSSPALGTDPQFDFNTVRPFMGMDTPMEPGSLLDADHILDANNNSDPKADPTEDATSVDYTAANANPSEVPDKAQSPPPPEGNGAPVPNTEAIPSDHDDGSLAGSNPPAEVAPTANDAAGPAAQDQQPADSDVGLDDTEAHAPDDPPSLDGQQEPHTASSDTDTFDDYPAISSAVSAALADPALPTVDPAKLPDVPNPPTSEVPLVPLSALNPAATSSPTSMSNIEPGRTLPLPTTHNLNNPNPEDAPTEASERARRSALLAALLILGTLGALGGGVLCFRCGVLPCCYGKPRRVRDFKSDERNIEEGLRRRRSLTPFASREKDSALVSLAPGHPPVAPSYVSFPRAPHAHTLSCSTCPPDSLNGVRGGVSGTTPGIDPQWDAHPIGTDVVKATALLSEPKNTTKGESRPLGELEDVTHLLSNDAFSDIQSASDEGSNPSGSPRDSANNARASTSSIPKATRMSTCSVVNATKAHARTRSGAVSWVAESYTTIESKYSIPSTTDFNGQHSRSPSAIASILEEEEMESAVDADEGGNNSASEAEAQAQSAPSSSPEWPSSGSAYASTPTFTSTSGSASETGTMPESVLPLTPDNSGDAAFSGSLPSLRRVESLSSTETETEAGTDARTRIRTGLGRADVDVEAGGSEWDIVKVIYSAPSPPPTYPIPPVPMQKPMQKVRGRRPTGATLQVVNRGEEVALGGRTVVLMRG